MSLLDGKEGRKSSRLKGRGSEGHGSDSAGQGVRVHMLRPGWIRGT